jgi:hypothetical protein
MDIQRLGRFSAAMDVLAEATAYGIRVYRSGPELWWESNHRAPCPDVLRALGDYQQEILRILEPGEIDLSA